MLNIETKFRHESIDGYSFSELKSAVQKYIRRSNIEKSMWVASRLDLFYLDPNGERLRTNFIHRLMIIFLEDIGFSGIHLWPELDSLLMDRLLLGRKSARRDREAEVKSIRRVVELLADAKQEKSRSCLSLIYI